MACELVVSYQKPYIKTSAYGPDPLLKCSIYSILLFRLNFCFNMLFPMWHNNAYQFQTVQKGDEWDKICKGLRIQHAQ